MNVRSCHSPRIHAVLNNRQNGYILFSLLIVGTLIMCMAMSTIVGLKHSLNTTKVERSQGNAFNIAEAGKEHALAMLRDKSAGLDTFGTTYKYLLYNVNFSNGRYSVKCKANTARDTVMLLSEGISNTQKAKIEVVFHRSSTAFKQINAVIMNRRTDTLSGNITIDGRDYDTLDTGAIGPGVLGVYTCDTVTLKGSAAVGGPAMDSTPPSPQGMREGSVLSWGNPLTFPRLPEYIFGLDSGALDIYKKPPPPTSGPPQYKCKDSLIYWDSCDLATIKLSGKGVIICHNANYTATLRNVHGSFHGIIIADKIDQFNGTTDFLGMIFTLSKDSVANFSGNGGPNLHYCSKLVQEQLKKYSNQVYEIASWKEL